LEIIIGKLAPYGALGVVSILFIYIISRVVFGVPFVGNFAVFGLGALLFLAGYLGQGLAISVATRKQMIAMQMAMMTAMLPSQLLSGFIFPVESMPKALQYFTMILPARWFMEISRDTFLKGSSLFELAIPFTGLALFCLIIIFMGTRSFKRNLEP
jgi:ABC-2 type transport system permease protein